MGNVSAFTRPSSYIEPYHKLQLSPCESFTGQMCSLVGGDLDCFKQQRAAVSVEPFSNILSQSKLSDEISFQMKVTVTQ